jgi:hypothetical protein
MAPRVIKPEGFKHLDRVVDLVRFPILYLHWCWCWYWCFGEADKGSYLVRCKWHLHHPGYAYRARRPESRLAFG